MRFSLVAGIALLCASMAAQEEERVQAWRGDIERYRMNYVVGGFTFDAQIKFQLSVRYRIFSNYPLYFAYSQRSFWDLYDWENSTPFRESNYMPELFYRLTGSRTTLIEYLQMGIEHESNGRDGPDSRSWNKFVAATRFRVVEDLIFGEARLWVPFAIADENRDIRTYIGFGQLTGVFHLFTDPDNNRLEVTVRPGIDRGFKSVTFMVNLLARPFTSFGIDLWGANPYLMFQVWHGYGENLIEYNIRSTRFRAGFTF